MAREHAERMKTEARMKAAFAKEMAALKHH